MIDEAQSLSMELLEEIRLLANIETNDQKLLSLVLAGQPELGALLDNPSLRQLKQRVALRCELRPLTMQEGLAYLAGRVRAAGGDPSRVFTREGAVLLHERAAGIPRTMNVIADNALITGFARSQAPVTRAIVTEVSDDFSIDMPPEADAPDGGTTAVLDVVRPAKPAAAAEAGSHQPMESVESGGERRTLFSSLTAKSRFLSRKGIA
jgi:general secretion pathway protein A